MAELHILHLNDTNRTAFDTLTRPQIDTDECIRLTEPANATVIEEFIAAHKALFLKPQRTIRTNNGVLRLYSVDATVDVAAIRHAERGTKGYSHFVEAARTVVSADIKNNVLRLGTDPHHELGVLFRSDDGKPWSIATTRTIPKIDYINDLLNHPKIEGLDGLLGMHTYDDAGKLTKVLIRYYKFKPPTGVLALPLIIQHHHGEIQPLYSAEDFFLDKFQPEEELIQHLQGQYGKQIERKLLTPEDLDECKPLAENQRHFVIYKTKQTAYKNQNISGLFLQTDANNDPVITREDATALDKLFKWVDAQHASTPYLEAWAEKGYKAEKQAQAVKVELSDSSYLIDTGTKLSLHGDAKEDYLRVMLQHAKENWGGRFKIENGSDTDIQLLERLAGEMNVKIIKPYVAPSRPTQHAGNPHAAAARPAA